MMLLSAQLTRLHREDSCDAATVARLLLPRDDDGIVFARIWLGLCEAGRSDLSIGAVSAFGEAEQHAMVEHRLPDAKPCELLVVGALVTGLRARLSATDPISLADAREATRALRR